MAPQCPDESIEIWFYLRASPSLVKASKIALATSKRTFTWSLLWSPCGYIYTSADNLYIIILLHAQTSKTLIFDTIEEIYTSLVVFMIYGEATSQFEQVVYRYKLSLMEHGMNSHWIDCGPGLNCNMITTSFRYMSKYAHH